MDPITREGLIDRYVQFLDEGGLDGIEPIVEAAKNDPELRALITEVNRAYAEEAGLLTALDAKIHTLNPLDRLAQKRRAGMRSVTRLSMRLVWGAVAVAAALLIGIVGGRYFLAPSSSPFPKTYALANADLTRYKPELERIEANARGLVRSTDPVVQDSSNAPGVLHRLILARSIDQLLSIHAQAVWNRSQEAKVRETMGELREVYAALSPAGAEPMRAHAAFLLANAALMLGDTDEARYWLNASLEMQEWKEEAQSLLARLDAVAK